MTQAFKKRIGFIAKTASLLRKVKLRDPSCRILLIDFRNWVRQQALRGLREEWACAYCNARLAIEYVSIDHDEPLEAGGRSTLDNFNIACQPCNTSKGALGGKQFTDLRNLVGTWPPGMQQHFWRRMNTKPFWGRGSKKPARVAVVRRG